MNPFPRVPQHEPLVRAPGSRPGFHWSRGLVAGALGLTLLQAAAFAWLARIPGAFGPAPPSSKHTPASLATAGGRSTSLLAIDGLREEGSWLPNPRQFLNPEPGRGSTPLSHPVQMDLAAPNKSITRQFLPVAAAPAPLPPTIPRPEFRPPALDTPRPASPPTHSLALTNSQVSISGALQRRGLLRPMNIARWTGSESLGVTRVEVSVNPDGEVVLARVVESCGVKAADQQFLAACRTIRFAPAGKPRAGHEFSQLERGQISLRWPAPR